MERRDFLHGMAAAGTMVGFSAGARAIQGQGSARDYDFEARIGRRVLENYLSRSICMEGMLHGRGDLEDNLRMLRETGARYIARSICLWGKEAALANNLERVRQAMPRAREMSKEIILEACIFEIVTTEVEQVPVPDWVFVGMGLPVEKRNFRYAEIIYPAGPRRDQWGPGASVPDVSRPETKLWFFFLAASYINMGVEGIHFGQVEIMNGNDPHLDHWSEIFTFVRNYAARHARRRMVLCNGHVPSGGLERAGRLLLDFHAFPLRVREVPEHPEDGVLQVGYLDSLFGRSKGGQTWSGWSCQHLPYLVELDNWGASAHPGMAGQGGDWVWGYDEITWFAHQSRAYRARWLRYAWDWLRRTDPNGHLEMPGGRTMRSPLDHRRWYAANRPSAAVPEGLGDEEAIRAIWMADAS